MRYIKALAIGALCGLLFALVAILLAPLGRADEGTYINYLGAQDVPVLPGITLALGHHICASASESGVAGINHEVMAAFSAGVPADQAGKIIAAALYELCPSNIPVGQAWALSK